MLDRSQWWRWLLAERTQGLDDIGCSERATVGLHQRRNVITDW